MKARHDAWTLNDDTLLAESVLRHIREGSTQVAAFHEVGGKLNRTPAACGYRWNAVVRNQNVEAVEMAKNQKKNVKKMHDKKKDLQLNKLAEPMEYKNKTFEVNEETNTTKSEVPSLTLDDCIDYLRNTLPENPHGISEENKMLLKENQELQKTYHELSLKFDQLIKNKEKIEHDYKFLLHALHNAQKTAKEMSVQNHVYQSSRRG
ncbi:hypothetical protein WQ54_30375 [Bacillus sp. SA1-12]|uniref:hypothetical protein n=1 Tax=Bacillus sp. SA1-12 TaxID=1455638 RepID=UPI0006272ABF|nr:hypothetical protein [Bacillus sp. SA1-12]KKI88507.1 hypothetical protein WQ54_30375 [Bacillus sp. SA1-12]